MIGIQEQTVVQYSDNLDKFRIMPSNRPIDYKRVDRLAEDMANRNLLKLYPIVIDSMYNIRDGQHRYMAARKLGLGIYYIVSDDADIEDIAMANRNVSTWKPEDYLHHYCRQGRSAYLEADRYLRNNEIIPIGVLVRLGYAPSVRRGAVAGDQVRSREKWQNGSWVFNNRAKVDKLVEYLLDFIEYLPSARTKSFIAAAVRLVATPVYDHERMKDKLKMAGHLLTKQPTTNTYLDKLDEVYNWKAKEPSLIPLARLARSKSRPE